MAESEGITEQLKATDQVAWVVEMNNIWKLFLSKKQVLYSKKSESNTDGCFAVIVV